MKKSTKRNQKRKGFTLVELIAVMAILGILALLVIPRFSQMTEGSKVSVFENTSRVIQSNVALFASQHNGTFPGDNGATKAADIAAITTALPTDWATRVQGSASPSILVDIVNKQLITTYKGDSKDYKITYDFATSTTTYDYK